MPPYLKSVNGSWFQLSIAHGTRISGLAVLLPDGEVLLAERGVVAEGVVRLHDLVGRPGGVLLHVAPAGEELLALGVLGVVLAHDDAVAEHRAVLVTEVVLPEPDGDRVHRPRHLGREHGPGQQKYLV